MTMIRKMAAAGCAALPLWNWVANGLGGCVITEPQ